MIKKYLTLIEEKLNLLLGKKAPALPENVKEFIVKYSPYLCIVVIVLFLPSLLLALGLGSFFGYIFHPSLSFYGIILLLSIILQFMAIPGLKKRSRKAWEYMFYASILSLISSIFAFNKLGEGIISALISFYILFQIKSYYKN